MFFNYKTPILKDFYKELSVSVGGIKQYLSRINDMLKNIDLRKDALNVRGEVYQQEIILMEKYSVSIWWDIDKLHSSMVSGFTRISLTRLFQMLGENTQAFDKYQAEKIVYGYPHSSDYITLVYLSPLGDYTLVDGNHRVLERLTRNEYSYTFKCLLLQDEACLSFLYPESRKLISLLIELKHIPGLYNIKKE